MISPKTLVLFLLSAALSAQENYTKTTTTAISSILVTAEMTKQVPTTLIPRATSNSYYPSYSDMFPSEPEPKKRPNFTPLLILIPLMIGIVLMGGIFCCVTRCGKRLKDSESQSQAQQQQWGDSSTASAGGAHVDMDGEALQGRHNNSQIREPPRFVLRDENGITVVEEAPPVYSLDPRR
ncbi:hypothetical protein BDV06DRAFT_204026 [Aspergillus oleicola]